MTKYRQTKGTMDCSADTLHLVLVTLLCRLQGATTDIKFAVVRQVLGCEERETDQ